MRRYYLREYSLKEGLHDEEENHKTKQGNPCDDSPEIDLILGITSFVFKKEFGPPHVTHEALP